MNKKIWTSLFIRYGRAEAVSFYNKHQDAFDFQIISEPKTGLTMVKVREHAENSLFYLGEVLITETKIKKDEYIGLGVVKGEDMQFSEAMSFIDLCMKKEYFKQELADILTELENIQTEVEHIKTQALLETKVDFSMMNE